MSDIVLNPEDIEEHYNALYTSSEEVVVMNITIDPYTNLSIRDTVDATNEYDMQLENQVRTCIQADAQNLLSLGATFIQKDTDVSNKIDEMLS